MENILGFLVFVAIVVISILNKIATERKAGREELDELDEQERPQSLDELPEATRRMIFGDGDIIVAKPRGGPYESAAPTPRAAVERQPVPARRIAMETPPAASRSAPARRVPVEVRPASAGQMRQQPAPTVARPPLQQQSRTRQPRPQHRQQAQHAARQRLEPPPTRRAPARKPVAVKKAAPARPRPQGIAEMLHSKNELARAVLLREILGPPKAFEDFSSTSSPGAMQ